MRFPRAAFCHVHYIRIVLLKILFAILLPEIYAKPSPQSLDLSAQAISKGRLVHRWVNCHNMNTECTKLILKQELKASAANFDPIYGEALPAAKSPAADITFTTRMLE
eukprot:CAMPEP_0113577432 /NCGR_PEP_ID=MMETSP0015_2-20120614/28879_1 /TAXON_ID=2838 /ORGANISM="Odontella" /LENGTH=107 /DNA_ID=CAMNT_0000481039 /DNA_START=435 /DNA_END=756 /DNA_ORIENTATION=+ /assembly_acc=CAM_ASM_000160